MRKVIANEWMSLDGVIQSSGSDDGPGGRQVQAQRWVKRSHNWSSQY